MTLPFKKLILESIKQQGLTNKDLVKKLLCKNQNKFERRLTAFLEKLEDPGYLYDGLRDVLCIRAKDYYDTYEEQCVLLAERAEESARQSFRPSIKIDLHEVSPKFVALIIQNMFTFKVDGNLHNLHFHLEIKKVIDLYMNHKQDLGRFLESDKGFLYYRKYGETFVFDSDCRLIQVIKKQGVLTRGTLKVGGKQIAGLSLTIGQ